MPAVCLHVNGLDLDDEDTVATIVEHFAHYAWGVENGIPTVTVFVENEDIASSVATAARQIMHRLDGVSVVRVYTDLVNQADVARRVGVSREAVRKWTRKTGGAKFPPPFDSVAESGRSSKLWEWRHVAKWLLDTLAIDMEEDFLDDATVAGINACLARAESYHERELHYGRFVLPALAGARPTFVSHIRAAAAAPRTAVRSEGGSFWAFSAQHLPAGGEGGWISVTEQQPADA